ncbi:hypothetical protein [Treponema sp. R80B11-R83G3]
MKIRTIGKFGFLLAAIGFFMPVACNQNAFQLIEYVDAPVPALIIGLFILAIAGILIGALLLMKKNVSVIIDWVILLVSIVSGIDLLSKNELDLQYGAYVIITGFGIALLLQIISLLVESLNIDNKTQHSVNINSHLLDITSLLFSIIMLLLCIFVNNNPLKIVVFSVLLILIIVAGTYERLREEK